MIAKKLTNRLEIPYLKKLFHKSTFSRVRELETTGWCFLKCMRWINDLWRICFKRLASTRYCMRKTLALDEFFRRAFCSSTWNSFSFLLTDTNSPKKVKWKTNDRATDWWSSTLQFCNGQRMDSLGIREGHLSSSVSTVIYGDWLLWQQNSAKKWSLFQWVVTENPSRA